ncbi:hypothetical protein [Okeania sp. SIO1F9]|uniref:hypothetical protein n=1 Tax=Okeania sp. SIO1F9 TaxID=2607813 RepID=UPI00144DF40C|nr:hypothetical protein [Okeania sp. SIO1F9]NET77107.1 hypothetical protein [Okeania sp. SIO1F9]
MNNIIIGTQLLDESEMSALNLGLLSLEESLKVIATDGSLLPIFEVAFGNQFEREKVEDLRRKWEGENLEWLPKIDIRSAAEINGANGAFAGANNTIYLAAEYISQNVGNGEAIANLLLEEVGHFVDYEINQVDTSGDEGDIFAQLVQGVELNEQELQALKTEDDTALVNIDGQQIQIEQNVKELLDTVSGAINDILDGLKDAKTVVEGVTSGLKEYLTVIQAAIDNQIFTKLPLLGDELQKSTDQAAKFLNDLNNDILAQLEQLEDLVNLSSDQVKQVLFDALKQLDVLKSGIDITAIPEKFEDEIIPKLKSEINSDKAVSDVLATAISEFLTSLNPEIFKGEIPTVDAVLEIAITEFSQELRSQFSGLLAEVLDEPLNIIREAFLDAIPSINKIEDIPESIPKNILNALLDPPSGAEITEVLQDAIEDGINQLGVAGENLLEDILSELETKLVDPLAGLLSNVLEQPKQLIEEGLEDLLGQDINIGDIGDGFTFNIDLNESKSLETSLASDIGFPGLGLTTDGKAKVDLGIDLNLGFGYTQDDGLFLNTSADKELGIGLNASLPGLEAEGEMGFLLVDVTDKGSQLNADYSVDVTDPNSDGKLTLSEVENLTDETTIFNVNTEPNASADINLNIVTNIDGLKGLPSIQSDLNIDWDLADSTPQVEFNNVQLDLGSFFDNFAKPIVNEIQKITAPITKVTDILTKPLPGLDEFVELSVLDIVKNHPDTNTDFIEAIEDFTKVVDEIANVNIDSNTKINLGSFSLNEDVLTETELENNEGVLTETDLQNFDFNIQEPETTPLEQAKEEGGANFFAETETIKGGGFSFPILEDPSEAFRLLLGDTDIDLFSFQMPGMSATAGGTFAEIPVWTLPPVWISFGGNVNFTVPGLTFGYDTYGFLEADDPFQGFFVDNRNNLPEFTLGASLFAKGSVGLPRLFEGGGKLSINGIADFDLNDPDDDGKVRPHEIAENIQEGLDCVFDIEGGVFAGADLYIEHITLNPIKGLWGLFTGDFEKLVDREEWNIATIEIFDVAHSCDDDAPLAPNLATLSDNGELRLHVGEDAGARNISKNVIDENFVIAPNITVSAFGESENHSNVSKITAFAGTGNDVISLETEVSVTAELHGGTGNDNLYGGQNGDELWGDDGSDRLIGREGNDLIFGGNDNDKLYGDEGDDQLQGDGGIDLLDGGAGNDQLNGGEDNDEIYGRSGNDTLDGESGDDQLVGGEGQDRILGKAGSDQLFGNSDDDFLDGGADNDLLVGGTGNDELLGGTGDDALDGGEGDDLLQANSGNDQLFGDFGNDLLKGEAGNDNISGGEDVDVVSYESSPDAVVVNIDETQGYQNSGAINDLEGNFNIDAATAQDGFGTEDSFNFTTTRTTYDEETDTVIEETIDVSGELENIIGSQFNDVLIGNEKDNEIDGNLGNDIFIGNAGNDNLDGEEGNDAVSYRRDPSSVEVNLATNTATDGFGDTDQIFNIENVVGSEFDDNITGDNNANIVTAGAGADNVKGGAGNDDLNGETGNDILTGEQGNDEIDGGDDTDTVNYDNSPNAVVVNIDESNTYSNDTSDANPIDLEPNFSIEAGTASDGFGTTDILTNLENIIGSESNDVLIGNEKDNYIDGNLGNDLVIGNAGNDNFEGGAGIDVVSYLRDPNAVEVNLATNTATDGFNATDQIFNIENVVGSEFDDNITGDDEANIITAEAGDDNIKGGAGDDQLYGQTDNDLLKGEQGNDLIDGGDDNDTVSYDNSPNGVVVNIDEQQDYQNPGGYQHTTIVTEKPIPTDTEPDFTIEKGTAQDGFGTIDTLKNLENIIGSEFNDVLIGNEKDNRIEGLAGDDIMVGNAGDDQLDGGNDNDTASYRRDPDKVNVNLEENQANDGFGGTDQILNTENVIGSDFNDTITGDEVDNIIHSGTGNDIVEARDGEDIIFGESGTDNIKGEDGNDFIVGGKDPDKLDGGNDNDTASYFTSESRVHVSLFDGKGWAGDAKKDTLTNIENLEGSEYEDLLIGDAQNNILSGLGGDDLLKAKRGNDLIDGGEGEDRLYGQDGNDTLEGQAGNDLLKGGKDHDQLDGGEGNDNLKGGTGKDTLSGGAGNDNLKGGTGDDQLDGGAGNDNLEGETGNDNLKGGTGNDQLDGGDGDDNLQGEAGDDQLYGMGGQDNLDGGSDDDLLEGRSGNDQLEGGEGNDRIYGNQGNDNLSGGEGNDLLKGGFDKDTLDGGAGNDELFGQIDKDLLKGGEGNDNLWGGGNDDRLYGGEGDDYLNGEAGNDTLEGNEGKDRLYGEEGDDEIKGNTGRDYLDGGAGNDKLLGNEDNDRIYGREGDDILEGGTGQDILDGGADDDFMYGEEGGDRLDGGEGEDYLDGGEGDDYLNGEAGDDHLLGQSGRDYLDGGEGEDILEGGEEADLLLGKEGDDLLEGGEGDDELDGGADEDQLYGQEGNDTLKGGTGNDYLEGGEGDDELDGGEGNDQLYGQEGKDILSGEEGNDNLYGGDDDDQLEGGTGNDLLSGEEGNDTLDAGDGDDNLEGGEGDDELTAGKGEDQLYGDEGDDTLDAGVGHDYIEGGEGDDEITAGEGDDQAYGGAGSDSINGNGGNDLLDGGEGDDVIEGEEGDDYIIGGEGDDELSAGTGNDLLEGGEGNDSLHGNEGDNILDGGEGDDELHGGSGSDTFVLQQNAGSDSIYNFQVDDDFFELIDLTFEELEIAKETESSDNTVIRVLDSGEQLAFVEGVKADELTGFHFFPFSGSDEAELETNEEEVEAIAETDDVVAEGEDITSDAESPETENETVVAESEEITSDSESPETDESDNSVVEGEEITSDSESLETDESDNSVAEEEDITSDSESQETENETVVEEDDIASDSESQETENETVVEEDDIASESESPETDESDNSVAESEDVTSDSESPETDESDNSVAESEDVTSDSESQETENETVVEEDDIASESESPETDESDNSVTEEAIASNEPKEEKTDTLTGEEVSTETDDELLNGGSDSPSDNTDEFLLAGDELASIPEIEVQELTTSSDNNMIEDDITTGSRTIETAERDSQDPVLAAIDTNNMAPI